MNLSILIPKDRIMIYYDTFTTFIFNTEAEVLIKNDSQNIYEEVFNLIKNRIIASTTKPVNAQIIHNCTNKAIIRLQEYKHKKINGED